ncbi:MAG: GNAT family N-acetyltransferase [Ignavibacteriales bacterium]|nr:GNAT family N-acetyltransferase [Ignavibacteriales bacterium]
MKYADAPANCSATLDMIIGKRHAEVVSAVINHLAHHHRRWDFLRFNPLNEHSLTPSLIEREALRHGYRFNKHPVFANAYIYVTADWNHYRLQVSARARKALAAYDRKLRELGVVTYEEFRTVEEIENRFNDLLSIEQRSWKWDVGVSINSVVFRDFYQVFAEDASRKGLLRLWMLKVNDKYIAYDYSAVFKGYLVSLKTSYDEAYRKYNPGNLLTWHEFEYFINGGIKRINLLWGDVKAKERWLTELESHYEVFVFNTSVYSRFLRMLFFSLSFYRIRRIIIDYRNRIARKAGLRLTESELTRSDQVKHRGVKIQSINQDAQIATTMTSMNTTKIHTEIKKQDTTVPVVVLKSFHHDSSGMLTMPPKNQL